MPNLTQNIANGSVPAIGSVLRPFGIATHYSPRNYQLQASTAFPDKRNRSPPNSPFSGQVNFDRVIILQISASYVDGVFRISEIAFRPSDLLAIQVKSRPTPSQKLPTESIGCVVLIIEIISRPMAPPEARRDSGRVITPKKRVAHRRCFPKKAKSRHCHRVRFPAIWNCDATSTPKLSTYRINGVSQVSEIISMPRVPFSGQWAFPGQGFRFPANGDFPQHMVLLRKRSSANGNERSPVFPNSETFPLGGKRFPDIVHLKIEN